MALPNEDDLKAYNRVTTDVEDDLFFTLIEAAQAFVQQYLRTPLAGVARTFRGRKARKGYREEPLERLTIPVQPCAATAVITDVDGDVVDSDTYVIEGNIGWVNAEPDELFDNGPYSIAVTVGYDTADDYGDGIEPILRQAILYVGSDLYKRRNPGAIYEQSGGQVSITYTEDALPPVIRMQLELLRQRGRAW